MTEIDFITIGYYVGLASCAYVAVLGCYIAKLIITMNRRNYSERKPNSSLDNLLDEK